MIYSSIFKDLTKQVQIRIDAASELNKRLFDTTIYRDYLDWDIPTIGLNFEEIIGSYNISVAAATTASNGKAPIMGTEGMETLKEKVLKHSISYSLTIDEYRKVLQIIDSRSISDTQRKQMLVNLMWKTVADAVNGVETKLDIMFLKALSNEGVCELNSSNNPEAGTLGNIDYKMPSENKGVVTTSWTDANIATVDCFEDIQAMVDKAQGKILPEKILLAQSKLSYILRNKKMKTAVFGNDKSSTPLLLGGLNEFMRQNGMPIFEVIRRKARIQNNGAVTEISPWNENNIVFVPSGKLGVVKNAFADSELRPEPGVAYSNFDRIRISQWGVGETQGSNGVEFTKAESLSLPVISEIGAVYSLNTIKP